MGECGSKGEEGVRFSFVRHWQHEAETSAQDGSATEKQIRARGREESMSQFWIWWLELHLVGSWKYRCGASAKG